MTIERFDELFIILKKEYNEFLKSVCSYLSPSDGVETTPIIAIVPDFPSSLGAILEQHDFSFHIFCDTESHNITVWIRDYRHHLSL